VQHSDPTFMTNYLANPDGAGRNFLTALTCNFAIFRALLSLMVCASCMLRQPGLREGTGRWSEVQNRARRLLAPCCGADAAGALIGEQPPGQRTQRNMWQLKALLFLVTCVSLVVILVMAMLLVECF